MTDPTRSCRMEIATRKYVRFKDASPPCRVLRPSPDDPPLAGCGVAPHQRPNPRGPRGPSEVLRPLSRETELCFSPRIEHAPPSGRGVRNGREDDGDVVRSAALVRQRDQDVAGPLGVASLDHDALNVFVLDGIDEAVA